MENIYVVLKMINKEQVPELSLEVLQKEFVISDYNEILKKSLKKQFGSAVHKAWFLSLRFLSFDGENLTLSVNSKKVLDCISLHYKEVLCDISSRVYQEQSGQIVSTVELTISNDDIPLMENDIVFENKQAKSVSNVITLFAEPEYPVHLPLEVKNSFANFITGEENTLALKIAQLFADKILGNETSLTPDSLSCVKKSLFLYGSVGNGKTHLLQSVANFVKTHSSKKIIYTTAQRFMLFYINSIKDNKLFEFQRIFLDVDVLLIDDLHFICKKNKTTDELYKIISSVMSRDKYIVFASASSPSILPIGHESFSSVVKSSLIAEIVMPGEELRYQILKMRSVKCKYDVSDGIMRLMAGKINSSIRELEGAFGRMVLNSQLLGTDMDFSTSSKAMFSDIFSDIDDTSSVSVDTIKDEVIKLYSIKMEDLMSKKRSKKISFARQIAMYLCSELTCLSYTDIGHEFSGRKHSTVIHAIKSIKKSLITESATKNDLSKLKLRVKNAK